MNIYGRDIKKIPDRIDFRILLGDIGRKIDYLKSPAPFTPDRTKELNLVKMSETLATYVSDYNFIAERLSYPQLENIPTQVIKDLCGDIESGNYEGVFQLQLIIYDGRDYLKIFEFKNLERLIG